MEFSIGRLYVKVEVKVGVRVKPLSPSNMSRWNKRRLAKLVLDQPFYRDSKNKIDRIKILRQMARDEGWQGWGLKTCKDWVEEVFADNGAGEIAL